MMAWSFVAAGAVSMSSTVAQPTGKQAGDLLIAITGARSGTATLSGIDSNKWTELHSVTGRAHKVFGRYATDDADDAFAPSWSSSQPGSQILAFRGGSVALGSIVVNSAEDVPGSSGGHIPINELTVPEDDCAIIFAGQRQKSATQDGITLTDPTGMDNRTGYSAPNGDFALVFVAGYTIQTTATTVPDGQWTASSTGSGDSSSVLLALSVGATAAVTPLIRTSGNLGRQLIR